MSKGLLMNVTGKGKGKSTSAFGMVVRALGWNWKVALLQFIKGKTETGEMRFFRKLGNENFIFEQLGDGLSWHEGDHEAKARQGWLEAKKLLHDPALQLLVLDELNVAVHLGYLDLEDVLKELRNRREDLHVLITGRYANERLLEECDLVSQVEAVKHPYDKGIKAQKGIDF